jgi:membrane protease subunit HflK
MPWNQPGGSDGKDPWGNRNNQEGPPDLDVIVKNLQKRFSGLFGGGRGGGSRGSGSDGGSMGKFGAGIIVLLLLIAWMATGIYIVEQGERAVILRFGKLVETTSAGLHWHFPSPIESREIVNAEKVNTVEVGYRSTRNGSMQSVPRESLMLTEDENIIDIAFAVQYRILDPTEFLFKVSDDKDVLVRSATEAAVRETIGKTKMDLALTSGRSEVVNDTRAILQSMLDRYEAGIEIVTVEMQHALPPAEVKAAFDDAVKAREDEVRLVNEAEAYSNDVIPRARGRAARIEQNAEAYKASVIANARGEGSRFTQIAKEYAAAPDVTRERMYIETMEKVLTGSNLVVVDQKKSNNIMYLPLDRVMNRIDHLEMMPDYSSQPSMTEDGLKKQTDEFRDRNERNRR